MLADTLRAGCVTGGFHVIRIDWNPDRRTGHVWYNKVSDHVYSVDFDLEDVLDDRFQEILHAR